MTKEQMKALGVKIYPNGDNPRGINRHGIPDLPTIPKMPLRAETHEDVQRVTEETGAAAAMTINNLIESKKIESELAGIRKELVGIRKELQQINVNLRRGLKV